MIDFELSRREFIKLTLTGIIILALDPARANQRSTTNDRQFFGANVGTRFSGGDVPLFGLINQQSHSGSTEVHKRHNDLDAIVQSPAESA